MQFGQLADAARETLADQACRRPAPRRRPRANLHHKFTTASPIFLQKILPRPQAEAERDAAEDYFLAN